jgi:hypothetical protein
MTQPATAAPAPAPAAAPAEALPKATLPYVQQVVSVAPFAREDGGAGEPALWIHGQPHPMMGAKDLGGYEIVRIHQELGVCVEVYSLRADRQIGIRDTIPWTSVRCVVEVMDFGTFIAEIAEAEKIDDPDPADGPEPEPNGAAS